MSKLALMGGPADLKAPLRSYKTIGVEEELAVSRVMSSGVLSSFIAGPGPDNFGGANVQEFEGSWARKFGVEHAITVNSWTSGLVCCVGAAEIEPFDEIITTPWTMCATATSILHFNAIPVFADIDPNTFTIDPKSVENLITDRTAAVMAVDIFGRECDTPKLRKITDKFGLKLITDSAQSPLVKSQFGEYYVGTQSDVGGYSLNYHKHFHTGEGGVIVTNNSRIADIARGIRNHGEANEDLIRKGYKNLLGHNFRLGEIECAIGIEQLKKGKNLVVSRQSVARKMYEFFNNFEGLNIPLEASIFDHHAFYIFPIILDTEALGITRNKIVAALEAEGLYGFMAGYANLSDWAFFQDKVGYGSNSFPWSQSGRNYEYSPELTPVASHLHDVSFMGFEMCLYELGDKDLQKLFNTFQKVWDNLNDLR